MKDYEVLFIMKANESEAKYKKANADLNDWITKTGGSILAKEDIGLKELAYEIKKQLKGVYGLIQFSAEKKTLDELEKRLRLDPIFLRHLVVTMDSVKPLSGQAAEAEKTEEVEQAEDVKETKEVKSTEEA